MAHRRAQDSQPSRPDDAATQTARAAVSDAAVNAEAFSIKRPRGRNFRWVLIGIITLLAITNYLDRGNLSVAAPLIQHDLHIDDVGMGVILSAFVWPYAITNLPAGWAIDRFGTKVSMAFAAGAWSIVAVATGFARTVGVFIGLRVLLGVSEAPMFPAALKGTDAWFPDREKSAATSVYIAGTQVGLAISPPIATALLLLFGWPAMFMLMGLLGFIMLIGWLILYNEPAKSRFLSEPEKNYITRGQSSTGKTQVSGEEHHRVSPAQWSRMFKYPTTWIMMVGAFCLQYVFWFYITWLPTYLEKAQHFSISKTGLVAALPFIAGTIAVLLGGRVSDWLVNRGVLPFHARKYTIAVGALLTAAAMFATITARGPAMAVTFLTIGMFTYSLTSGPYWTLAANIVHTRSLVASVGSMQNFGGFLGGAFAPILTGILVGSFGGFAVALVVTAILLLVSASMYGIALRREIPL